MLPAVSASVREAAPAPSPDPWLARWPGGLRPNLMGPGFMIQASSRALESRGRQQGAREETCPGNAAWSWSPTSGPLHMLPSFPGAHVDWLLGVFQPLLRCPLTERGHSA